jgi:hypothetical protein
VEETSREEPVIKKLRIYPVQTFQIDPTPPEQDPIRKHPMQKEVIPKSQDELELPKEARERKRESEVHLRRVERMEQ